MIYLVEDDNSIRELVVYTLQSTGFEARGFACGADFWEGMKEDMPELEHLACYMAYTAFATRAPLKAKLQETGMWKVYTEIELPLVFTLDSMEKWGIEVKGEELKNYGEKLTVRIHELEKLIWQQAGEEFNINSPKQLGVILFEKMAILL